MTQSAFSYRNGVLCAEAMPLPEIAEDVETPFFCTSLKQLKDGLLAFSPAPLSEGRLSPVTPSTSLAAVRALWESGAGAMVSSAGALERALEAGVPPAAIHLCGVGKTRDDVAAALLAGIAVVDAESLAELRLMDHVGSVLGARVPVALRLSLCQQGPSSGGFGFALDDLAQALAQTLSSPMLDFRGLSVSMAGLFSGSPCEQLCLTLLSVVTLLRGQEMAVPSVNLRDWPATLGSAEVASVRDTLGRMGCRLTFGCDRAVIREASVLVARVLDADVTEVGQTLVLDAGLSAGLRAALVQAHEILPLRDKTGQRLLPTRLLAAGQGETAQADGFTLMPEMRSGEMIAVMQAGALGDPVEALFGGRALAPEIMVSGVLYATVRRRVAVAEQMAWESIPDWMAADGAGGKRVA